jgi:antitoxin HigA-1
VRHDCIEALGLTITEAAEIWGVTRQTLNNLVNGKSGISADVAIRPRQSIRRRRGNVVAPANGLYFAQARQHEGNIHVKAVSRRKLQEPRP